MSGLTGLRGAQGGVMMFGMMGQFLPTAAATLVASNPVLLGAGALFGGMQLVEDRKRKVTMRRSQRPPAAAPVRRRRAVRGHQRADRHRSASCSATCATSSATGSPSCSATVADTAKRAQKNANQLQGAAPRPASPRSTRPVGAHRRSRPRPRSAGGVTMTPAARATPAPSVLALADEMATKLAGTPLQAEVEAIRARLDGPAAGRHRRPGQGRQVDAAQRARRRAAGADRRRRVHPARVVVPPGPALRGAGPAANGSRASRSVPAATTAP